jgi:hypothetical protein
MTKRVFAPWKLQRALLKTKAYNITVRRNAELAVLEARRRRALRRGEPDESPEVENFISESRSRFTH